MQLLVLKSGNKYIYKGEDYQFCEINKASVFKLSFLDELRRYCVEAEKKLGTSVKIYSLTIIEELIN